MSVHRKYRDQKGLDISGPLYFDNTAAVDNRADYLTRFQRNIGLF